jgi:hypothetical protein
MQIPGIVVGGYSMRGMAEKAIMISVMAVMGAGSAAAYDSVAEDFGAPSLQELMSVVDWDLLSATITAVLGN